MADTVTQEQTNPEPTPRDGVSPSYAATLQRHAGRHAQRVLFGTEQDLVTLLDFGFRTTHTRAFLHLNSPLSPRSFEIIVASASAALQRGLSQVQILIGPKADDSARASLDALRCPAVGLKKAGDKYAKVPSHGIFGYSFHWVTTDTSQLLKPTLFYRVRTALRHHFAPGASAAGSHSEQPAEPDPVRKHQGAGGIVSFGDTDGTEEFLARFQDAWKKATEVPLTPGREFPA